MDKANPGQGEFGGLGGDALGACPSGDEADAKSGNNGGAGDPEGASECFRGDGWDRMGGG